MLVHSHSFSKDLPNKDQAQSLCIGQNSTAISWATREALSDIISLNCNSYWAQIIDWKCGFALYSGWRNTSSVYITNPETDKIFLIENTIHGS